MWPSSKKLGNAHKENSYTRRREEISMSRLWERLVKKDTLESHRMSMHLKLRPHYCRYGCDMSYNDTSNRNQHEKRVHGQLFTVVKQNTSETRE